jgi:hypothetical protein
MSASSMRRYKTILHYTINEENLNTALRAGNLLYFGVFLYQEA